MSNIFTGRAQRIIEYHVSDWTKAGSGAIYWLHIGLNKRPLHQFGTQKYIY